MQSPVPLNRSVWNVSIRDARNSLNQPKKSTKSIAFGHNNFYVGVEAAMMKIDGE